MAVPFTDTSLGIPAAPPARGVQWRTAWRLLRQLVDDPDRTEAVFELFDALGGDHDRNFRRFATDPTGRRLLRERPSLVGAMADREALAALPDGSFGRAYLDFARARDFAADGLVQIGQATAEAAGEHEDAHRRYYSDRVTAMHDLWHVLTGYGTDPAGEATLLAFSLAQIPSRGFVLLSLTGAWLLPAGGWLACQRHLVRAYRRGRRAARLDVAAYEDLLPLPLAEVRRRLGIEPAAVAHPRGILRSRDEQVDWVPA
jgi:ubiquinone biosynthesis protein COQ4